MFIRKKHFNKTKRASKSNDSKKKTCTNERIANTRITYASQSEIEATANLILKKYAETFRRLAE